MAQDREAVDGALEALVKAVRDATELLNQQTLGVDAEGKRLHSGALSNDSDRGERVSAARFVLQHAPPLIAELRASRSRKSTVT